MPAVVDPNTCDRHFAACFPARICPQHAFAFDASTETVVIDSDLCGTCPGPCVNFCDQYAIRYAADPDEFAVLKAKTLGEMTEGEAAEALFQRKEAAKAAAAAASPIQEATTATFDSLVLQSPLPTLVDFWAPWCGPCKAMAPVFEKLAEQYRDHVRFVKVNVDDEPALAQRYSVQAIPTLGFFYRGQLVDAVQGALQEQQLQSLVYQFLTAIRQVEEAGSQQQAPAAPETGRPTSA